ncbi:putative phospholipase A(2) [Helianthus debilis subsp. tardiflorus]
MHLSPTPLRRSLHLHGPCPFNTTAWWSSTTKRPRWPLSTSTTHDNYLSEVCNKGLLGCVQRFKKAGSKTFKGNTCDVNDVTNTINSVMNAALLAGKYIRKP